MTAKMAAGKVEAFLAALAETGNASLAAAQAGLSRSWVNKARAADAGFDARVRAARAGAAARLGALEANRPGEAWRMRGGVELVVTRRGQVARAPGERRWTKRREERFLVAIRETRNLELAAPAVGMSVASLEKHRRRWPAFDRRVRAALRLSAGGLAMQLVVPVEEGAQEEAKPPWFGWFGGMTLATAINTVRHNRAVLDDLIARDVQTGEEEEEEGQALAPMHARIALLRARRAARRKAARSGDPRPSRFPGGT